uniref:Riboflavin transporter n=1 Tax=Arion vulgaris TaxID=1028688 RepID=A0A0B6Y6S3_9EUPU
MAIQQMKRNNETKFGVHVLVVIFGITSWSIMNGLWVELPVLVSHLPEGWTLPSFLTIAAQLGNIGIIACSIFVYCKPRVKFETPVSFIIAIALTLCALLYALFWRDTAYVADGYYSVALLGLTFTQSVFATMTSIAYVAFMSHLKANYIASIFIGMGISGLIPAFAAIGQGQGSVKCIQDTNTTVTLFNKTNGIFTLEDNSTTLQNNDHNGNIIINNNGTVARLLEVNVEPPFSVQAFFLMLFGVGILSLLSLLMLVFHPYCKSEHVDADKEENSKLMDTKSKQETIANPGITKVLTELTPSSSYVDDITTHKNSTSFNQITDNNSTVSTATGGGSILVLLNSEKQNKEIPADLTSFSESINQTLEINTLYPANEISTRDSMKDAALPDTTDDSKHIEVASTDTEDTETEASHTYKEKQLTKLQSWYLLGLLVWINALQSSFVLAIQVYSSLPYGLQFYHAATKAENIVDPIASFLTFWIVAKTTVSISGLTLLGTLFTAYIIAMAAMSPTPALVNATAGGILVVTAWVMCTILMVFSKVSIAKVMRGQGRLSLIWTGASTQLGAMIGAIIAYILINYLHLFKDEPLCH